MHNYSEIACKVRSAKIHTAAFNLLGAIERERDDEVNATMKVIADNNHREAANDLAKKRRIGRWLHRE